MTVNYCAHMYVYSALLMSVASVWVVMHPEAWKKNGSVRYDYYPQLFITAVMLMMEKENDRLLKTTKRNERLMKTTGLGFIKDPQAFPFPIYCML